jgi:hypothetical protein
MEQTRRNVGFLALLAIIVLLALSVGFILRACPPPTPTPTPSPEPTPTPPVVTIIGIRRLAELATVQYLAVAEVHNERVPNDLRQRLGVKEQVILLAYGDVKAGFDLEKLTEDDLWTDGTRVQLHLPPPEILSTSIDYERTHVVYYQKTLLISHDINWEGETFQVTKDAIQQAAIEARILENASEYGQIFFENFLYSLGFTDVQVVVN